MRHALDRLPLSRGAVDRDDAARRDPGLFDRLLGEPGTRVLPLHEGRTLLADPLPDPDPDPAGWGGADEQPGSVRLALPAAADVPSALVRVYLGRTLDDEGGIPAGTAVLAQTLTDAAAHELEPDPGRWRDLRSVGGALDDRDAGLFTEAVAIVRWHESAAYCPWCGMPTAVEHGGWVRRCLAEDRELFPRTDPAVIVGVVDDDGRLLLGSNAAWGGSRYSLLAGFVEPGESFEAAVVREVGEEAGVAVGDVEYLGSQPWPFPRSVMIGCRARLAAGASELRPDGEEIVDVAWFSRDELWRRRDEVQLPGGASIARAIIEDWYGGDLAAPPLAGRGWAAEEDVAG